MIAKLLANDEPAQIRNIQDLRKLENFKIIVKKQSFVEDLFAKSLSLQDLRPRIVLEEFETNDLNSLQSVFQRILSENFVLIDDKNNFFKYLSAMPDTKYTSDSFFFSDAIEKLPGAWIFPKGPQYESMRQKITSKVQYYCRF